MTKSFFTKTSIAASVLSLSIFNTTANATNLKFYAGGGVDYTKYGVSNDFKEECDDGLKAKASLVPFIGVKFHENFGVEFGHSFSAKLKSKEDSENSIFKVNNTYLDLVGFMPVSEGKFNLIAGLGVGKVNLKATEKLEAAAREDDVNNLKLKNKLAYRVKVGAEYNVTNNIAIRTLLTYQKLNNKIEGTLIEGGGVTRQFSRKALKDSKSIGLSVIYNF